jgi:hypothetical protein
VISENEVFWRNGITKIFNCTLLVAKVADFPLPHSEKEKPLSSILSKPAFLALFALLVKKIQINQFGFGSSIIYEF